MPTITIAGISQGRPKAELWTASSSIISLGMKPFSGGIPAMAAPASTARVAAMGIRVTRPPSLRRSRVPAS